MAISVFSTRSSMSHFRANTGGLEWFSEWPRITQQVMGELAGDLGLQKPDQCLSSGRMHVSKNTRPQLAELGSASIQPGKALPSSKACLLAHLYPSDLPHQKTEPTSLPQDSPTGLYCCWKSCSKPSSVGFEVLLHYLVKGR